MSTPQQENMMASTQPAGGTNYALMGFLAMAIAVVGLLGVVATVVTPLPLERAMARDATLDEVQAALGQPNAQQMVDALRTRLGESAAAILPLGPDTPARIATERAAMRTRLAAESREAAARLRLLIIVSSLMAAGFGAMLLQAGRRRE